MIVAVAVCQIAPVGIVNPMQTGGIFCLSSDKARFQTGQRPFTKVIFVFCFRFSFVLLTLIQTQHPCPRRDSNPQPFGPSDRDMPCPYRLSHQGLHTREEIKRRINMGNACYYSVEKLLSSSLLSKNLKVRIYKTVILPVVLYGCETWTLTLREEQRLRVYENKVLRKTFGAKRDEVTGEWRKLHNTELHALYSSPDIIRNIKSRRLRWAGHVARMGESRNAYRVVVRAVKIKLDSLPGSEVQVLRDKLFQNVFGKNSGYKKMCKVAQVLEGVPVGEIDGVCVCDILLFKYARLTSCDVERSLSQYKLLFRDNRHAFVMENLEMTFVVHCDSRPTTSTQCG
ncbi:hypothetical protein ANN_10812 [Periplaneta americana]|uniref:Uncharacterized protein n=1 Tax=Periplaneta americana TaxID=6978 RepID=A0ABQ8T400_PERAM|nr:hypothetical protein ANN_10812 [Periplaneta americana]